MAFIRANQGNGGSGDEGVLIWTNPNSTLTLASGPITLDSNLSNFSKIRIKWYVGGASAVARDEAKEIESIIPIAAFASDGTINGAPGFGGVVGTAGVRYFFRNNGDASNILRQQASIGSTYVPYKIYGIA